MMPLIRLSLLIAMALVGAIAATAANPAPVLPGIDVLREGDFEPLKGKRVGLLTHPAGVDSKGVSTITILHKAAQVNLVALFGPEHGIDGKAPANDPIDNQTHAATGLPVYSLYGKYRTPTDAMLEGLDVMVIDLQDIGVRSYTYVSCMRLTLEACFRNDIEVMILDRPNPLGGEKVDGPPMDEDLRSYVGSFPVPYVHGLTIGELARIAKLTEGWLDLPQSVRNSGRLTIIPMKNWRRSMTWDQTGLEWVPTSPGIPTLSSVLGYAMTGLGAEINAFRHGFGTEYSFRLLSMPGIETDHLVDALNALKLRGVQFVKASATDARGNTVEGAYVQVFNWETLRPTALSFHMMPLACKLQQQNPYASATAARISLFNKHVGSQAWWTEISTKGADADARGFIERWQSRSDKFRVWSATHHIYR